MTRLPASSGLPMKFAEGMARLLDDDAERRVTVCDACLCASCWQGSFPCARARSAGTREMKVRELDALGREHRSNYCRD